MVNQSKMDATPYFFLVTKEYVIGTPSDIEKSERTIDIMFNEFSQNIGIQKKLRLGSTVLAEPVWNPPLAYPLTGSNLKAGVAFYLSYFSDNPSERKQRNEYLMNNGLVRILITDSKLLEEIKYT